MADDATFGGHFFSDSYTFFDGQLNAFLNEHYQNVVDAVKGPLTAALVIYIALYAFLIMRGVVSEPLQDFIWRMAKLCLLFVAATTVAYQDWIVGPIFNAAPSALTQAISGKDYKQAGATFDHLDGRAAETYKALRDDANAQPITNIGAALEDIAASLVLELAAAIACIVGFALSIFALVGLAFTIALGPIFIALSLFEWGKGMLQGWLRQAFSYVVQLAVITTMAALKRIEVVTVRINQLTGAVDVQTELTGKKPVAYDEAVTKFFLANYVRDRESWNPAAAKENFDTVAILSTPVEQQRWNSFYSPRNPASPRNVWGDRAFADARITSISFINTRVANVRFTRTVQTDTTQQASDWIATVTFGYTNAPMSEGDRFRNPLGFQVETYRSDPVVTP